MKLGIGASGYLDQMKTYTKTVSKLGDRYVNPEINKVNFPHFTKVAYGNIGTSEVDILIWLEEHTTGRFYMRYDTLEIGFENPEEATYFNLGYKND